MDKIIIVKTLPHTQSLFIDSTSHALYISNASKDTIDYAVRSEFISKDQITFSGFLNLIASAVSAEQDESYQEKYQKKINQYDKVDTVESPLEFSVKGDVITVWIPGYAHPIRAEFFDEELERLAIFDHTTSRTINDIDALFFSKVLPSDLGDLQNIHVGYVHNAHSFNKYIFSPKELSGIESYYELQEFKFTNSDYSFPPLYFSNLNVAEKEISKYEEDGFSITIQTGHKEDLPRILQKHIVSDHKFSNLPAGFISNKEKLFHITDRELFGSIYVNKVRSKDFGSTRLKKLLAQFEGEIAIGDFVVHEDYGIGKYVGLRQEIVDEVQSDYLLVEYAEDDELYVPLNQIEKITRYFGNGETPPKLTSLKKGMWQKVKEKVKNQTYISAKELVKHFAKREMSTAEAIDSDDSDEYADFVKSFEHEATRDQITAINEIIHDMSGTKPMNRLLVGDVGFGKTEVIMRTCFKVIENGGQVAVLAPTTVLASQHFQSFTKRFKGTDFRIASVSRFSTPKENTETIERAKSGEISILIGTHRLLSNDVKFENLNLLVVDEEQKFGVKQKEKLKQLNYSVHVLSVSATPIPRTLSLALSSVQDISVITTPPTGRKPIHTEIISRNDWNKISSAIANEVSRGGQVYYVHNRVETIQAQATKLMELLPGISVQFAHGQMSANRLDSIMTDFYQKKYDVLVSTTIIESGLDLPNVNTMVVNDAHRFGLSQLYQLRGRVGRSERPAYCFLVAPRKHTNKDAPQKIYHERLQALVENNELGAAFRIASKDLEIRGAGTILGAKQHGHIAEIGYALYIEMLSREIEKLKNEENI